MQTSPILRKAVELSLQNIYVTHFVPEVEIGKQRDLLRFLYHPVINPLSSWLLTFPERRDNELEVYFRTPPPPPPSEKTLKNCSPAYSLGIPVFPPIRNPADCGGGPDAFEIRSSPLPIKSLNSSPISSVSRLEKSSSSSSAAPEPPW